MPLLWIIVLLLVILAIGGGVAVSNLLWLLLVVAVVVALFGLLSRQTGVVTGSGRGLPRPPPSRHAVAAATVR